MAAIEGGDRTDRKEMNTVTSDCSRGQTEPLETLTAWWLRLRIGSQRSRSTLLAVWPWAIT